MSAGRRAGDVPCGRWEDVVALPEHVVDSVREALAHLAQHPDAAASAT